MFKIQRVDVFCFTTVIMNHSSKTKRTRLAQLSTFGITLGVYISNTVMKLLRFGFGSLPNYAPESALAQERQTALKEEIKNVGYKPKTYSSIEYLSQLIIQDMKNAINVCFPSAPEEITEVREQIVHIHRLQVSCA